MQILSKLLRSLSLTFLTGGSSAIVFAAIVLVKAATAKGVPVAEAAAVNAPIFIQYSKVALACAGILLVSEILDFVSNASKSKIDYAKYLFSVLSVAAVAIFSLVIVPPMEQLLPDLANQHEQFRHLHEQSRAVFGTSMLFAFVSMLLPIFKKEKNGIANIQSIENSKATVS